MGGVLSRASSQKTAEPHSGSNASIESENSKEQLIQKEIPSPQVDPVDVPTQNIEENILHPMIGDPCGVFVYGLNPNWDRERMEKWLNFLKINYNVVTKKKRQVYGSIKFDNDDDRIFANKVLQNEEPNDEKLTILPLRKTITMSLSECQRVIARKNLKEKKVNIVDLITPLYNKMSYEEQINLKKEIMKKDLGINEDIILMETNNNVGFECKTKLLFGRDENEKISLGLFLGERNNDVVTPIDDCINIPKSVVELSHKLKDYAIKSKYPIFDRALESGVWKFANIMISKDNKILLVLGIHGKSPDGLREDIKQQFECLVNSLFFVETFCKDGYGSTPNVFHLSGEEYLIHKINDLHIIGTGISLFPFLNNIYATELLLKQLNEIAIVNRETILLDLFCGSGVLGLSLSSKAYKLIGIDSCEEAINESNRNAKINNIMNSEFKNNKVENALKSILSNPCNEKMKFTVIIDPPNNGIKKQILNELRDCSNVQQIIFVCSKTNNFLSEAKSILTTQSYSKTSIFEITDAIGIDAYPYKEKIEYVISMKREK